jgi:rhodanese-related sulfurtransferase
MRKTFLAFFVLLFYTTCAQSESLVNDTIYRNLSVTQADSLIQAEAGNPDFIIIDVRTIGECASTGILENSINIDFFNPDFDSLIQALDHSKRYLIYCASGSRSGQTFTKMQNFNFKEVYNMLGGISAWLSAGKPVVTCCTGIDLARQSQSRPLFYPNPVSSRFTLTIGSGYSGELWMTDIAGRTVLSRQQAAGDQPIDLSACGNGVYFLTLITDKGNFKGSILKL